jgi:hypothetical protein
MKGSIAERLDKYISKDSEGDCWSWLGQKQKDGTGVFFIDGKDRLAKHIIYNLLNPDEVVSGQLKNTCGDKSCVNPSHHVTREKIMWSLIDKDKIPGCWIWVGQIKKEYGFFSVNGKDKSIARIMYERHNKKIPKGTNVFHSCENSLCVNPSHLHLTKDFEKINNKNRRRGAAHHWSTISEQDAEKIKSMRQNNLSLAQIHRELNISYSIIRAICASASWKHVKA